MANYGKAKTTKQEASIVKLDPKNSYDMNALDEISKYWDSIHNWIEFCFADDIYKDALKTAKNNTKNKSFLALTLQNSNFEHLEKDKILGLAEVVTDKSKKLHKISYLQAHPSHTRYGADRGFKRIGKRLMEFILKNYPMDIELTSLDSLRSFYKKFGFRSLEENKLILRR